MAGFNIRRSVVASAILVSFSHTVYAQSLDVAEARQFVMDTCPISWEAPFTQMDVVPGADIWQSNLGDKARYIRFSSPGVSASDSDGGGLLKIKFYNVLDSISACSSMRQYFLGVARLNAQIAASFDHTTIRDDDADGIFNAADICSNTVAGESVDADGCSATQLASDADGDGVHDAIDQCPSTATNTVIDATGCPVRLDSDGDGVYDDVDAYPLQHNTQCTD